MPTENCSQYTNMALQTAHNTVPNTDMLVIDEKQIAVRNAAIVIEIRRSTPSP